MKANIISNDKHSLVAPGINRTKNSGHKFLIYFLQLRTIFPRSLDFVTTVCLNFAFVSILAVDLSHSGKNSFS